MPRSGRRFRQPPGADDWERLAAFMGRDPRASLGHTGRATPGPFDEHRVMSLGDSRRSLERPMRNTGEDGFPADPVEVPVRHT